MHFKNIHVPFFNMENVYRPCLCKKKTSSSRMGIPTSGYMAIQEQEKLLCSTMCIQMPTRKTCTTNSSTCMIQKYIPTYCSRTLTTKQWRDYPSTFSRLSAMKPVLPLIRNTRVRNLLLPMYWSLPTLRSANYSPTQKELKLTRQRFIDDSGMSRSTNYSVYSESNSYLNSNETNSRKTATPIPENSSSDGIISRIFQRVRQFKVPKLCRS